ncbi:MAG: hypothetical protein HQL32_18255 [Planctomycetes bacterium]|nr:hypothetical protein [Planctomycetota bacterium]
MDLENTVEYNIRDSLISTSMLIALFVGTLFIAHYVFFVEKPEPMVQKVIPRTTLLKHPFAGVCTNCHDISHSHPVALNKHNMNNFTLTFFEKQLLIAGQEVVVPNADILARAPALTREDILPHKFMGVCSNCHSTFKFPASKAYIRKSMITARKPLDPMAVNSDLIARGLSNVQTPMQKFFRVLFGGLAVIMMALNSIFVIIRLLLRRNPEKYSAMFDSKTGFQLHIYSAVALLISFALHIAFSVEGNNFLHITIILLPWLFAIGCILKYRMGKGLSINIRLAHSQQILYCVLLILLVIGHWDKF